MAELQNMNALIQFTTGEGQVWDGLTSPIPNGMWIYDSDNNVVVEGDGVKLFSELTPIFDFQKIEDVQAFYIDYLPQTLNGYTSKVLKIKSDGSKYEFSSINVTEMLTLGQLNNTLNNYATVGHNHDDRYVIKDAQHPVAAGSISGMTVPEADIVSYLTLEALDEDNATMMHLANGYADEFETEDGIDIAASDYVFTQGVVNNQVDTELSIVSTTQTAEVDVEQVTAMVRMNTNGVVGRDVKLEISRDDGATWAAGGIFKRDMHADTIDIYTGECNFDGEYTTSNLIFDNFEVEDIKGTVTTFVVDTKDVSGHFDSAVSDEVIGSYMKIPDLGTIVITGITGDGTSTDSVTYDASAAHVIPMTPTVSASTSTVDEGTTVIPITIDAALGTGGVYPEELVIYITNVPTGIILNKGTDNGDGSWTLTESDLSGLTFVVADSNYSGTWSVIVKAQAISVTDDINEATYTLETTINPVADTPNLTVGNVSGVTDEPVELDISASLNDPSETLSIRLTNVPADATLNYGTLVDPTTWDLTPAQLNSLAATFSSANTYNITATATATESDNSTAIRNAMFIATIEMNIGHGVAVAGGTAIGPYTFADGQTGYIVVPSSSVFTNKKYGYYNVNTDSLGLACSTSNTWTDTRTGLYNTQRLCTHSGDDDYTTPNDNPAHYCNNLVHDGCSDYFLPNVNELLYVWENRSLLGMTWPNTYVWSSSQRDSVHYSWLVDSSGGVCTNLRCYQYGVVPVRRVVV
jgi:hypothetical protein